MLIVYYPLCQSLITYHEPFVFNDSCKHVPEQTFECSTVHWWKVRHDVAFQITSQCRPLLTLSSVRFFIFSNRSVGSMPCAQGPGTSAWCWANEAAVIARVIRCSPVGKPEGPIKCVSVQFVGCHSRHWRPPGRLIVCCPCLCTAHGSPLRCIH